jgi:hypothetical protein
MDGGTRKPQAIIAQIIGRPVARLGHELGQLMICSCPGDPAMIEILLKPGGDLWQDGRGRIHVAGAPSQPPHISD